MSLRRLRRKNVKIVHVIMKPYGGGAEKLVGTLVDNFVNEGIGAHAVHFVNPKKKKLGAHRTCLDVHNQKSPVAILKLRECIRNICREHSGPVILNAHLVWPLYYAVPASALSDVRLVHTVHNTWNRRRAWKAFRLIDSSIYAFYDRVIAISDAARRKLENRLTFGANGKIRTVQNGVDIWEKYKLSSLKNGERVSMVSVGKLSRQKGFGLAIRAVASIKDEVKRYTIVGDGDGHEHLQELAYRYGVENIVEFVGWQSDIEPFLQEADIQLIPSRWEGFGLVAVEGMAKGLPVVAADVPGLRDVLGSDNEFNILVGERDADLWADAILKLKERVIEKGANLSRDARCRSQKFSTENMVRGYAKVYAEIV